MKNFVLFSLCLLFGLLQVEAQNYNFEPGYVVTLTNDTLRGEIDFRTDTQNNLRCRFKKEGQNSTVEYLPADISLYRFTSNGKYYVSHEVTIEGQKHTFFLEYLIQGLMNVYYFNYEKQSYYLFEKEDGSVIDLITKTEDGINDLQAKEDLKYDGRLRYFFDGFIDPKYKTRKIDFDQKVMIEIAKSYHDQLCTTGEECIVFENKNPYATQVEFKVSAYTGLQFVSTKIWSEKISGFEAFPAIGGELNVSLPRLSRMLSFVLDLSFSRFKLEDREYGSNSKVLEYSAIHFRRGWEGGILIQNINFVQPFNWVFSLPI